MHVTAQRFTIRNVVDACLRVMAITIYIITEELIDFVLGDEVSMIASCNSISQTEP